MEAMLSINNPPDEKQKTRLLQLARRSIEHGVAKGAPVPIRLEDFDAELQQPGATFVTLHKQGQLRGCIGSLSADKPLASSVAANAFSAAFRDSGFPPVTGVELDELHIHISVLTPLEPMAFSSESELLAAIEPKVDGIVLEVGHLRGTFLPSVWQQLSDKREFLQRLKLKAGMSANYWSPTLKAFRYHALSFEEQE